MARRGKSIWAVLMAACSLDTLKFVITADQVTTSLTPLTRRDFFQLTERCQADASELARYDQGHVNLAQCHKFNAWLQQLKGYDLLAEPLRTLAPARPITRWQVMTLAVVLGLVGMLFLASRGVRTLNYSYFYFLVLFLLYFIPQRLYGTTIELLEGKLLRIVDLLYELLQRGDLEFSEAAFFQAKENLSAARRELRQQIDLAHRRGG